MPEIPFHLRPNSALPNTGATDGFIIAPDGSIEWKGRPPKTLGEGTRWVPWDQASPEQQAMVNPDWREQAANTVILDQPSSIPSTAAPGAIRSMPDQGLTGLRADGDTFVPRPGGSIKDTILDAIRGLSFAEWSTIVGAAGKFFNDRRSAGITEEGRDIFREDRDRIMGMTDEARNRLLGSVGADGSRTGGISSVDQDLSSVFADPSNVFNLSAAPDLGDDPRPDLGDDPRFFLPTPPGLGDDPRFFRGGGDPDLDPGIFRDSIPPLPAPTRVPSLGGADPFLEDEEELLRRRQRGSKF